MSASGINILRQCMLGLKGPRPAHQSVSPAIDLDLVHLVYPRGGQGAPTSAKMILSYFVIKFAHWEFAHWTNAYQDICSLDRCSLDICSLAQQTSAHWPFSHLLIGQLLTKKGRIMTIVHCRF